MNDDYLHGSREEFLSQLRFYPGHHIAFNLPSKTDEEIIDLLFKKIETGGKERLFYSQDKKRIVYIYKNSVGSYSIGREKMTIFYDEERYYSGKYGFWKTDWGDSSISFYGTLDEAVAGITNEINDYCEMKLQ